MKKIQINYFGSLLLLSALFVPTIAPAEVVEDWIQLYDGGRADSAKALAVDAVGNVYVTGYSYDDYTGSDYATIKYDADGNLLWLQRYDGGGYPYGGDYAIALAVDATGNVYVTGNSQQEAATGNDYTTIKYDTDGNLLWIQRYDGGAEFVRALAVDAAGNVYVTGESSNIATGMDYATIKYDTDGNLLWIQRYDGGNSNSASALAVDAAGNVYVTGYSFDTDTGMDYATIKYDADGNLLWVQRYDGGNSGYDDYARTLAVDAVGNVYVTGESSDADNVYDYATIKYDTDGNLMWVQRYDGGGSSYNYLVSALTVDATGNVYVTGYSYGTSIGGDYDTIKYDTDGNLLWVQLYDGGRADSAKALAVDAVGNVYVTGYSYDDYTGSDYATIKYDTDGNLLWLQRYDGGGSDSASALAVDVAGNVYVTGESSDALTGGKDYSTIKYAEPVVTLADMMEEAIGFYEDRLDDGTIYGLGVGNAGTVHERLFGRMLYTVYDLILAGDDAMACHELSKVLRRIDEKNSPPDLVGGPAASLLHSMLLVIYSELRC